MRTRRTSRWVLLSLGVVSGLAVAFPIAPQTIWDLVAASERIVYAEVVGHEGDGVAKLRVLETWKGLHTPELRVHYEPGVICPAPAVYADGERVVAFLDRDEDGRWGTVGLSYGTRYPADASELDDFRVVVRDAVNRAPKLQTVPGFDHFYRAEPAPAEWALLAAMRPGTRWDGLYLLAREGDAPHARYAFGGARPFALSDGQKKQLADSVIRSPPRDRTLPMVLLALRGHPSPALDAAVASALDDVIRDEPPYWSHEALQLFRERLGAAQKPEREPPGDVERTMADAMGDYTMEDRSDFNERIAREWSELKAQHPLQLRALPPRVERPVYGVGGETPL